MNCIQCTKFDSIIDCKGKIVNLVYSASWGWMMFTYIYNNIVLPRCVCGQKSLLVHLVSGRASQKFPSKTHLFFSVTIDCGHGDVLSLDIWRWEFIIIICSV